MITTPIKGIGRYISVESCTHFIKEKRNNETIFGRNFSYIEIDLIENNESYLNIDSEPLCMAKYRKSKILLK